jgi:hypothetical protein
MEKEKKKRERKDKKDKKEAVKKALEEQKNDKEDEKKKVNFDVNVPINFEFLCNIYNVLINCNSRIHWEPDELIPFGMTLRDLKNMIEYYENVIKQKNSIKEDKELSTNNEKEDNLSTSATQSTITP